VSRQRLTCLIVAFGMIGAAPWVSVLAASDAGTLPAAQVTGQKKASPRNAQRATFQRLYQAASSGKMTRIDVKDRKKLADYPIAHYPRLRHRYLSWLASGKHWREYLRFYQPAGATVGEQCHALWAEISQSPPPAPSLDKRIEFELAFARRNLSLARYLARQMKNPPDWVTRGVALLQDPAKALPDSLHWPSTDKNRWLVYQTALHQAQKKPAWLRPLWPRLRRHFGFEPGQRRRVEYRMALFAATDYEPFSIKAMKALPTAWQDDPLRAWKVRYWLQQQRWREVAREIEAMPQAQRNRERWRYWLARAYAKTGKIASARKLFLDLAQNANYYGFLSADHLRLPYQICQQDSAPPAGPWQAPAAIERAIELYHAGLVGFAKLEWNQAYYGLKRREKLALAERVKAEGWHNKLMAIMGDTGHWKDRGNCLTRSSTPLWGSLTSASFLIGTTTSHCWRQRLTMPVKKQQNAG